MKVAVLGAGAWGTALACLLADNGHDVMLWSYEQDVADAINHHHSNHYLKDISLSRKIIATSVIQDAITYSDTIFIAIPVAFIRTSLLTLNDEIAPYKRWIMTSKGIEQHSLLLPTQILEHMWHTSSIAAISGPSFAYDLVCKQITGILITSHDEALRQHVNVLLANDYMLPELSSDVIGVQLCGALKNIIALGVGILDGAGYTDNTKIYFLIRALDEMMQMGLQLGAQQKTLYGLAGIGDVVLTAMGRRSKNLEVGRQIGKGESLDDIAQQMCSLPEGINTLQSIHELMVQKQIAMPLCSALYEIIFKKGSVETLFER